MFTRTGWLRTSRTFILPDAGPVANQSNFRRWARLLLPATQGELATKQRSASCWKVGHFQFFRLENILKGMTEFTRSLCDNCFIAVCSDGLIVMWCYRWCVCVWLHQSRQECKNICPRTSGHQDITEHSCTVYAISELL